MSKKEKRKTHVKRKKKKDYGKKRETPVRTLSLFSFKKDYKLEFSFKGLTLGFKKKKKSFRIKEKRERLLLGLSHYLV